MFYCDECAKKYRWPWGDGIAESHGPCEMCGKTATCNDFPSRLLPKASESEAETMFGFKRSKSNGR